jgi:hypothetical protein
LCLILATALLPAPSLAHTYGDRTGLIRFVSHALRMDFSADNKSLRAIWDSKTGKLRVSAPITYFRFADKHMESTFNENDLESLKYTSASFEGTLSGLTADQAATPGTYPVTVEGELRIHGVTRPLKATAKATVNAAGAVTAESDFKVACADHEIPIPSMVSERVAKIIEVHVELKLVKMSL